MAAYTHILATDTSTRYCSVALCRFDAADGQCAVLAQTLVGQHKLHAERLLENLDRTLKVCHTSLDTVDCLAVSIGPGSFTGLRVGAATWKGLAFARNLPLVAVPTLDAMSLLSDGTGGLVIPMIDARMDEVFGAAYRFSEGKRYKVIDERACSVETLLSNTLLDKEELIVLGDGAVRYRQRIIEAAPQAHILSGPNGIPRADAVAVEAYALLQAGADTDPAHAAPRYLRVSQAEQAQARKSAMTDAAPCKPVSAK